MSSDTASQFSENSPQLAVPVNLRELYLPTRHLDTSPNPISPINPVPGNETNWQDRNGTLELVLYVGETGNIDFIDTGDHNVPQELVSVAVDSFLQAKMEPATKAGSPVKAKMRIVVEFHQIPITQATDIYN